MMTSKEQPDLVGTKENRKSIKEAFHAKDRKLMLAKRKEAYFIYDDLKTRKAN